MLSVRAFLYLDVCEKADLPLDCSVGISIRKSGFPNPQGDGNTHLFWRLAQDGTASSGSSGQGVAGAGSSCLVWERQLVNFGGLKTLWHEGAAAGVWMEWWEQQLQQGAPSGEQGSKDISHHFILKVCCEWGTQTSPRAENNFLHFFLLHDHFLALFLPEQMTECCILCCSSRNAFFHIQPKTSRLQKGLSFGEWRHRAGFGWMENRRDPSAVTNTAPTSTH